MIVELHGTRQVDDAIERCPLKNASAFSVYIGEPGDFEWLADFKHYNDALNWAEEVADVQETELIDYISQENSDEPN